jgi:DNA-binding NarL/FixJ family response regulator
VTTTVVVVDDQELMRAAFRTVLGSGGIEVIGEAGTASEGVALVRSLNPDVVLMDVRMPGRNGLDATSELVATVPNVRVLVLTTFDHDEYIDGALRAGAAGFLLKNAAPEALVEAVRAVAAGDGVLDPSIVARVMKRFTSSASSGATANGTSPEIETLTEREKDVLGLMCSGCTNAEIAKHLGVGEATSKTHVSRVLDKLGVRDRVQAVIHAYQCGFAPR